MKKIVHYLFLFTGVFCSAQETKSVYFIGNSYTGSNNLPNLIQQVAASTGDQLEYQTHTPGGSNFQQHAGNTTVFNTINLGTWDYVVLQQQSQMPAFPNATATLTYAQQLCEQIKNANTCTTPLFFMTWGHKNGDTANCANGVTYLCTYEGMDDKLYERYMQMTNENNAVVSPVGRVWRAIRTQYPSYELYTSDGSHPSLLGSMAAAYTFYTVIYKKDPTLATFNSSLDSTVATNIKNVVKNVVYSQLEEWKVGVNDTPTQFSAHLLNSTTVQFTNETEGATEFLWDFGDGTTSTEENPSHTYANNQSYTVQLTTNACESSYRVKSIDLATLSTAYFLEKEIKVYPNPVTDVVYFNNLGFDKIQVFDMLGKEISLQTNIQENEIALDVRSLPNGVYYLRLSKAKQEVNFSFIKR